LQHGKQDVGIVVAAGDERPQCADERRHSRVERRPKAGTQALRQQVGHAGVRHDHCHADHCQDPQRGIDRPARHLVQDSARRTRLVQPGALIDEVGNDRRVQQDRPRMSEDVDAPAGFRRGGVAVGGDQFGELQRELDRIRQPVDCRDEVDGKCQHHQDDVTGERQGGFLEGVTVPRPQAGVAAVPGQARHAHAHNQPHHGSAGCAQRPQVVGGKPVLHGAHHRTEEQDGRQGAEHALPAGGNQRHDGAAANAGNAQKEGGIRCQQFPRQPGDRHQGLEGGGERAKINRPAMPNARHDDRLDGMETQPNQQRRRHRHRHAKPAHPLQEGGEKPAKQQALHGFVGGQRWQCAANHPHRPGFIGGVEEQQSRPDNVENIQ